MIAEYLEAAMVILFGCSWPNNIINSLRTKSTKGKSILFMILIDTGYICGILSKIISGNFKWWVLAIYILNFVMVSFDMCLYFYNYHREKKDIVKF